MKSDKDRSSILAQSGIFTAILASLCCITPVLALIAGASGVAASFSWLEPFRPYLIGLTVLVLGLAWYQKLKPRSQEELDCECEEDGKTPFLQSRLFLGLVTGFAVVMLAFPYYAHIFYPKPAEKIIIIDQSNVKKAEFDISGMTCTGCEEHVKHSVNELPGIVEVEASYEEGKAIVQFDKTKVDLSKIKDAIDGTGYKVTSMSEDADN